MGKLIETLQRAVKGSGSGIGFLGRNQVQSKPKAAALFVALSQPDAGAVEALVKAGADGGIFALQNGETGAGKLSISLEAYQKAAEPLKAAHCAWGLDLADVVASLPADALKGMREGGADFVSFPLSAPARVLQDRPEGLDRIVTLGALPDDPYLLLARSINLLSVQAVRFDFGLSAERLRDLTIEELLRYRMLRETLRFPALVSVEGNLGSEEVRTLVKAGASAVVVQPARGESAPALASRVAALREELERVPGPGAEDEEMPSVAFTPGSPAKGEEQPIRQQ
jgi:hypothetical protein